MKNVFTFLSFFPFFLHVNTKLQETTYVRREREREKRARKRAAAREDDGRRSCGDDKRIGENKERH